MKKVKLKLGEISVAIVRFIARKSKIDLFRLAYRENGLLNSHSLEASGEKRFIVQELQHFINNKQPVFFDVGANKGSISQLLRQAFPTSTVWSFEPNPNTFKLLNQHADIQAFNLGFGKEKGVVDLYFDKDDTTSVQATADPTILKEIAGKDQLVSERMEIRCLDDFCEAHQIDTIDFLKIDTEGFELEVLQGAQSLLSNGKVKVIQFEFNEVNIVKRRFLRDFYELLPDYRFYRIGTKKLIDLEHWQPIHEIFVFQNILAIRK
jgi:FkbM family methyltransferase